MFKVWLVLFAFAILMWVRTIIDIVKMPAGSSFRAANQVVWLLLVILVPFIGVPLYWIIGSPERR